MKAVRIAFARLALAVAMSIATIDAASSTEDAVAYQENVAHTGSINFAAGFSAPLKRLWVKDLGGPVSYPLIVGNMVFVTVGNTLNYGSRLLRLDLATGNIIWQKPIDGTYFVSHIAYDQGRIYDVNPDGLLRAFVATTGRELWSRKLRFQYLFLYSLIATGGQVFAGGSGVGGNVYAVKGRSGLIQWSTFLDHSADSTPAFGDKGVYVSVVCNHYRLSSSTGKIVWHINPNGCYGGGGGTPVFYNHLIFAGDSPSLLLNAANGKIIRPIQIGQVPAIWTPPSADPLQINPDDKGLSAYDIIGGAKVWSFVGDSIFVTPPLVINGVVAAGSVNGTLYILDAASGEELWSSSVGASIGPVLGGPGGPLWGLNAGSDVLLVPAQYTLSAYVPQ
jgi:outer membrane protein assembly factor BamB